VYIGSLALCGFGFSLLISPVLGRRSIRRSFSPLIFAELADNPKSA